ncbi:hypothetical protein [Atlantibacter sp.]|uniref:hypothetical protein n=1 Tax=Atlantibacter sp. TaxID=1903473 RepID=UPI0028966944|nr:hypothetical protein [Atlantibacter sp.]
MKQKTVALMLGCMASYAYAADAPQYDDGTQSVYLQYYPSSKAAPGMAHTPGLRINFPDGDARPVEMDTGSTGIVISADAIPNIGQLTGTPGKLVYNSSGRIMIGTWVTTPVTLSGSNGTHFATAPIPVLAVTQIACQDNARHCTPEDNPRGVAMMGVGFAREGSEQQQSTPATNPLLNPATPEGFHKGYVVTREGVHVGLNAAVTGGGFSYVKLEPDPQVAGEWQPAPVCIVVNNDPKRCGTALIDTGVTDMFLTVPHYPDKTLPDNASLTFTFTPQVSYTIAATGDDSALAPEKVILNTTRVMPFVNTGVNFLNGFDVLYDAKQGYFGYRPVNRASQ